MGLYINSNIAASGSASSLRTQSDKLAVSQQRLATGIKSVSDDASSASVGFAIQATINSLTQATSNATQGNALLQYAMATLSSTQNVLQRMSQLSAQANSDAIDDTRRAMIDKEFQSLLTQIDTNSQSKWFDTQLFTGTAASSTGSVVAVNQNSAGLADRFNANTVLAGFVYGTLNSGSTVVTSTGTVNHYNISVVVGNQTFTKADFTVANNATLTLTSTSNSANTITVGLAADVVTNMATNLDNPTDIKTHLNTFLSAVGTFAVAETAITGFTGVSLGSVASTATAGQYALSYDYNASTSRGTFTLTNGGETYTQTVDAIVANPTAQKTVTFNNGVSINLATNFSLQVDAAGPYSVNVTAGSSTSFNFQTGQAASDHVAVSFQGAGVSALGLTGLNVNNTTNAQTATSAILAAMTSVSNQIATLGGKSSQLSFTIDNLNASIQNQTAAKSTFTDVDVADELINTQKLNATISVAQTMFTQATQAFSKKAELVQAVAL